MVKEIEKRNITNLTTEPQENGILIKWDADSKATGYKIYRSTSPDEGFDEPIAVVDKEDTEYLDSQVEKGKRYYYKVVGIYPVSDTKSPIGGSVKNASARVETYLPSPRIKIIVTNPRYDTPIADATIKIEGENLSDTAQTDAFGKHTFKLKREGTYTISVNKSGFMPISREVDSAKGDEFELSLKPIPKVIETIADPANPFRTPAYVVFSSDGNRAYVTNRFGNDVSVINASNDQVLKQVDVGNEPLGLAVNPVKPELYVVNHSDNTISVIDTDSCKVVGEPIKVGRLPTQAVVNSNGTELYVVNSGENSVSIVKLSNLPHESKPRIYVGQTPYGIAKSPDDRYLYVTNEADDNVSVVSLLTKGVERKIPVGRVPKDVAVGRDGRYVLVSNHLSANVAVIDLKVSPPAVRIREVGRLPTGIVVIPEPDDSQTAYIALKAETGVRIFDFATMQIIDEQIHVGTSPVGIDAHPAGNKIYVVNSDRDSVTVLGWTIHPPLIQFWGAKAHQFLIAHGEH